MVCPGHRVTDLCYFPDVLCVLVLVLIAEMLSRACSSRMGPRRTNYIVLHGHSFLQRISVA